jgi:hypothetical protein
MVVIGANTLDKPDSYNDYDQNNNNYDRLLQETRNRWCMKMDGLALSD